ncbi:hypothetical protein CCP2SC5_1400003 [Azospirillaceae bacterium]
MAGLFVTLRYGVVNFHDGFHAGIRAFTAAVWEHRSLPGRLWADWRSG